MARMIPSLDESLIHFGELPGYGKIPSANYTSKQRTKEALAVIIGGGRGAKTYGLESLQLENEDGNEKLLDISASHICLIISLGLFHLSTLTRPSDPSLLEFSQQMSLHLRPEINWFSYFRIFIQLLIYFLGNKEHCQEEGELENANSGLYEDSHQL